MSSNQILRYLVRVSVTLAAVSLPASALAMPEIDPGSSVAPLALVLCTFVMLASRRSKRA